MTTNRIRSATRPCRRRVILRRVALALVLGAVLCGVGLLVLFSELPGVGNAEALVVRRLGGVSASQAAVAPASRIARSIVAIEDERFYEHDGIDVIGVARATWNNASGGNRQGASTITQQLAKVLYTDGSHSIERKLETIGLALKLEDRYSKRQILDMYLNSVYFGAGCVGVVCASERYFGKLPGRLDWAEASMLAGLPQAPSAYDPLRSFARARVRQREVLDALTREGVLSRIAADAAFAELHSLRA